MRVEDRAVPGVNMIGGERQHRAARAGVAPHAGDHQMRHGVEHLMNEVVDRVDVAP